MTVDQQLSTNKPEIPEKIRKPFGQGGHPAKFGFKLDITKKAFSEENKATS